MEWSVVCTGLSVCRVHQTEHNSLQTIRGEARGKMDFVRNSLATYSTTRNLFELYSKCMGPFKNKVLASLVLEYLHLQ
jgi:hypothetical protein